SRIGDISIYCQELNYTTWRLCKMDLTIRGIDGKIKRDYNLPSDRFSVLKVGYILANPSFTIAFEDGSRCCFGGEV
ncbi:MAG: N-6 DNA methylase, partial [Candidatus Hadarchaeum sp.]|uniref:N-6 DNA methylase n=1 Tax=Candidatus Hadarchaeum sp. TaxID=2883567 RepID=UPI003D0B8A5A